jgi:hypothetical protein
MRLALLLPFVIIAMAPAAAQQAGPSEPSRSSKLSASDEILRQRILLRERFNKGWDIQPEDARQRLARCKSEARKRYSVIHQIKRRNYDRGCTGGARR